MAQQKTLAAEIRSPQANALTVIGQVLNVAGTVIGRGGAEPVGVDDVTIQVGANAPVTATVKEVAHTTVPSFTFESTVQVPGPPGLPTVQVTVHFDNNSVGHASQSVVAASGELTGVWSGDDGTRYFLKENISSLWWVGMDTISGVQGPGLSITNVFRGDFQSVALPPTAAPHVGPVTGIGITGMWADVPRGTRTANGTLTIRPSQQSNGLVQQLQVSASTGGFTTTTLNRTLSSPELSPDIQALLGMVQKNVDGASLGDNLTAFKDHVVLFGTLVPQEGQSVLVNWSVNAGRTYQAFICAEADGEHDGDANIDITVDRTKLDSGGDFDQPGFWTDGWVPGVDPNDIKSKLDDQHNHLHLELVMFGRAAKCSQPDQFDNPPLMPGWQEMDGNSVLVNGRPLNGLPLDPITGLDGVPTRVVVLNNKPPDRFLLRVTGTLVLDVGHLLDDDKQEIHPVYAIDVVDATPQQNLSGVWADNLGNTYYVRHVADSVWWFGMSPVRDRSFAQVFNGTLSGDIIDGAWQDVPFGTSDASGGLRLTLDPTRLRLVPDPQGSFASRRWLKLYD